MLTHLRKAIARLFAKRLWLSFAEMLDAYRVFPRALLIMFTYEVYTTSLWFKSLDTPTAEQVGYVSAVLLAFSGVTKFYLESGRTWGDSYPDYEARYDWDSSESRRGRSSNWRTRPSRHSEWEEGSGRDWDEHNR